MNKAIKQMQVITVQLTGGKVLAGLTSRRAKESDIYFKKIDE